uniref:Uncharacterized protein n=1 Tax=Anguilla anguilla TaxID=7936 RepID=A0A0E9PSC8_ANGAN
MVYKSKNSMIWNPVPQNLVTITALGYLSNLL